MGFVVQLFFKALLALSSKGMMLGLFLLPSTGFAAPEMPFSGDNSPMLLLPEKFFWEISAALTVLLLALLIIGRVFRKNQKSIQKTTIRWNFFLAVCLVFFVFSFNTYNHIREYQDNLRHIQERLLDKTRTLIRNRVSFLLDFIEQEKRLAEIRMKEHLQHQVDLAFQSVQYLIENTQGKLPPQEVSRLVIETLRPMRHSNGRGYLFATRMDGIELLFADRPEFEGRNMLDLKDNDGVYYVREMIRVCREQGEGFVSYRISKPGSIKWDHRKLAYVRYLKQLDCFIGTGEYLEDFTEGVKKEVAERLQALQFSGELSIFGGDLNGNSVFGPGLKQNMLDVTDRNGLKVVQELIKAAQAGGGFVQYHMPESADSKQYPKLSYVEAIPDWNWYVGAGINLDQVEAEQAFAKQSLEKTVSEQLLETAVLVPLAAFIFLLIGRHLSKRIDSNVRLLQKSLEQAAQQDVHIDVAGIEFDEFIHIAESANQMLQKRQQTTEDLRAREENLSVTLDSIGDAVIVTDALGRVRRMNPVAEQLTGWRMLEAEGRELLEIFPIINAKTGAKVDNPVHKVLESGKIVGLANHTVLLAKDGTRHQIADSAAPIRGGNAEILGVVLVFRDVTEEYALHQALKESEGRFRAMFDNAPLLVALADGNGKVVFVNEQWAEATGRNMVELLGRNLVELIDVDHRESLLAEFATLLDGGKTFTRIESGCVNHQGENIFLDLSLASLPAADGRVNHVLAMAKDVTERRIQEKKLEWVALHDELTGLANRNHLLKFINRLLMEPPLGDYWLFLFDLNRFKSINDNYGHATGDTMLRETGRRLKSCCPEHGLAARLSGDEFVIVAPFAHVDEVYEYADLLRELIRQPVQCGDLSLQLETSIGAAPIAAENTSEVLRRADLAMYQIKRNRFKEGIQLYNDELEQAIRSQRQLEADLTSALKDPEQFILHYQPIWSLRDGTLKGVEALVRWQHPSKGLLPPGQFISLAEERALIVPLGKIVLRHACRDLARWAQELPQFRDLPFRVSVNMAPQQLMTADLVESVIEEIARKQVPASKICLEITETALMDDPNLAARHIASLQAHGISIAIDDFGNGYSSLSYLNQFNVNTIKLDRSLINGIDKPGTSQIVSKAVIRLAHDLNLDIVAEGVETPVQLQTIKDLGCDYVQGYLTGRPMPATEILPLLQNNRCDLLHT